MRVNDPDATFEPIPRRSDRVRVGRPDGKRTAKNRRATMQIKSARKRKTRTS